MTQSDRCSVDARPGPGRPAPLHHRPARRRRRPRARRQREPGAAPGGRRRPCRRRSRSRRYPDHRRARGALAARLGVDADRGAGHRRRRRRPRPRLSAPCLRAGPRAVLPGRRFEMIPRYACLAGAEVGEVPWWQRSTCPVDDGRRRAGRDTALVAVVSPNNPTGAVASPADARAAWRGAAAGRWSCSTTPTSSSPPSTTSPRRARAAQRGRVPHPLQGLGPAPACASATRWATPASSPGCARVGPALPGVAPASLPRWPWLRRRSRSARRAASADPAASATALGRLLARARRRAAARPRPTSCSPASPTPRWVRAALAALGIARPRLPRPRPSSTAGCASPCPGDEAAFARLRARARAPRSRPRRCCSTWTACSPTCRTPTARPCVADRGDLRRRSVSRHEIAAAKAAGNANNDWELTQRLLAEPRRRGHPRRGRRSASRRSTRAPTTGPGCARPRRC